MKPAAASAELARLVRLIDEAFQRKSWHGTNLRGSLRGLPVALAGWRPAGGRHSIADIVVHCAYWKYAARRRLRGDPRGSFPLKGSNWFKLPDPLGEPEWKEYIRLLDAEHRAVRDAVGACTPRQLATTPTGRKVSNLMLIHGIALHDVYHAGQIQMLKGLAKRRK
jgi:uncharacterized damage-inducible protein DinB